MYDLLSLSFSKKHEKSVAHPEWSGNAEQNPSRPLPFYTVIQDPHFYLQCNYAILFLLQPQ